MKQLLTLLLAAMPFLGAAAQEELTTNQAKQLIKTTTKRRVSIHDPSVVYEPNTKRYYIFGSHKAGAWTTDLQNWTQANPTWAPDNNATAFGTPAVKKVMKGGVEVDFPQFDAREWSARTDASYDINGNMWAPDVIWNEKMQKWCMYLSINGDKWHSSIILLTSSSITGPYTYQGPVVICGFQDSGHSYKDTDLELVLGQTLPSLPSRYNVGDGWGRRWPHTIDPSVFYDEQGNLWMVYGSWSGGIWMLELDENTGLRDYDVVYPSTGGSTDGVTSDPYYGTKVGGGYYVSGEGPYIEHIGNYYFLFVSYGGFAPDGGYEMRVFRSDNPNGPYKDSGGRSAIFDKYVLNFGAGTDNRGEKIMGAYNLWGNMTVGECAQGHNSIIAAPDGRTYLVYHTKFNDGTVGHQVRTHQVFLNKNGWLVASPFEYNGEQLTDEDIATRQLFTTEQIAGTYQYIVHKYAMDHKNYEEVTPGHITLREDGKVTGDRSGSWSVDEGTSYLKIVIGGVTYNGVIFEQQLDGQTIKTISFSGMSNSGVNIWGYKMAPKYELASQLSRQTIPVTANQRVGKDVDLYGAVSLGLPNVTSTWTSSEPDVISHYGKYNPAGLTEDLSVTLTARAETTGYYWQQEYPVKAAAESYPTADWQSGMVAHYGFDRTDLANSFDATQKATLHRTSSTALPKLADDELMRTGSVVHVNFGGNGKESYVQMPNPLYGKDLTESGATLSFWVKRTDNNLWDAFFGFQNGNARFYMTGNSYVGYNSGTGNWVDINHPANVTPTHIAVGQWQLVTLTISKTAVTLYVNGAKKNFTVFKGEQDGTAFSSDRKNYAMVLSHLSQCQNFCMGKGSFWGSPDMLIDDVIVYDRALRVTEVLGLSLMENRVYDFWQLNPDAIEHTYSEPVAPTGNCYDLQGRLVRSPKAGLYIVNGKKVFVK